MNKIAKIFGVLALVSMSCCSKAADKDRNTWQLLAAGMVIAAIVTEAMADKSNKDKNQ